MQVSKHHQHPLPTESARESVREGDSESERERERARERARDAEGLLDDAGKPPPPSHFFLYCFA